MSREIKRSLHVIGAASGIGSIDHGTHEGPSVLERSEYLTQLKQNGLDIHWDASFQTETPSPAKPPAQCISEWCEKIAKYTQAYAKTKQFFLVTGGDNTSSMGVWSGVHGAIYDQGPLGLIWIDAHMDSHTHETSETGMLNGMPLAGLLGYGDPLFTNITHAEPKLLPQHVCLIGSRSFETGEHELLKKLGVRIFYVEEVHERGFDAVLQDALKIAKNGTAAYGICIDIDVIDPEDAPGVGNPEPNGLRAEPFCKALTKVAFDPQLIGFEVVELNPSHDVDRRTEKLACEMISAIALGESKLS